jgi:uncharacterized protein YutE (UPF0331/DUF86 family)
MRRERYLEKLEVLEGELNFIEMHRICDEVTERALLHSLQVCVEISMDVVAMLMLDIGLVAEDDYTNIEKLAKEGVISKEESETLKNYNGLRNAIVHRYNHLDMKYVEEGLAGIDGLYAIVVKLAEVYERLDGVQA